MLTTDTPDAQLFNMPSRAASPPKLAPYPMDVGNRNDRHGNEPRNDARQRALHPGDDDDDAGGVEAGTLAEQAVDAGHADVVQAVDVVAHQLSRAGRLLGDRQVGRAGRDDQNAALAGGDVLLTQRDDGRSRRNTSAAGATARTAA